MKSDIEEMRSKFEKIMIILVAEIGNEAFPDFLDEFFYFLDSFLEHDFSEMPNTEKAIQDFIKYCKQISSNR